MNTQELIQEAAVIRDERNQYANTAERVGTALVHMAEQLAAQAADVDKVEADVRGSLTLAQLDNPLGFTTNVQWAQGLNEDKTYTFRLVDTSGRCIGHVWLLNDADYDSSRAARFLEMVMCCASIDAETGALTTDARWGSPRLYYRTFCTPLSGGTPDGGLPASIFKWSAWQEYRDYVAKPIKDALAALQQQHSTDVAALQQQHATAVAGLQANIDAAVAAIPTGVLNLGMTADADTILAEAAKYAVASDPFKAVITGQYTVGTAVQSIVIHQQVTKNSNGSGVCMQYVYKDKARYARYINFNAAASVTAVQGLQPDGVRNLYYTDTGFIGQRDAWGTQVGSGFFLPNKNDLREGTPTATSVPLVLTKAIKDTVTCNLGPATTARAGVMTVEQVKALQSSTKNAAQIYELGSFATLSELDAAAAALVDGTIQWATNYLPCILLGYYETDCKAIYWQVVENSNEPCVQQIRFSENGTLYRRRILLKEMDFNNGNIIAEQVLDWYAVVKVTATPVYVDGGLCLRLNADESTTSAPLPIATANKPGIMSTAQVQQLADAKAKADKEAARHYTFDTIYNDIYEFIDTTCEESPEVWANGNIEYVHSYVLMHGLETPLTVHKITYTEGDSIKTNCYIYFDRYILYVDPAFTKDATTGTLSYDDYGSLDSITTVSVQTSAGVDHVDLRLEGFDGSDLSMVTLGAATTSSAGVMTSAQVKKLANLEARIAAIEAK